MARIALVEDESTVSDTIIKILARAGHRIDPYPNASEALALCDFTQIDLVLTDLIMESRDPDTTQGEQLIQALHRIHPQLPIMIITGAVSQRVDELAATGVHSVLRKPFEPMELVEAVAELV